ncbi:MAG: N-acetylmuramidase domain-containing protein [Patescibacteria group bacterium]
MKKKGITLVGVLVVIAVIVLFLMQSTEVFAQELCDFSGTAESVIKGNASDSGLIYHVPGEGSYEGTQIDESKGERWFCTEQEAVNAGWRPTEYRASQGGVPEPEPTFESQPLVCDFSENTQLLIKGNVSSNGLIYHVPGDSSYSKTTIDPEKGERWFCQERQALRMNWRPTQQRVNRAFSHTFQQGYSGPEVKYLQVVLNWLGFTIAQSGLGSLGNETEYFDALTRGALQRFQESHVPSKLLSSGIAGPLTRAKLAQLLRVTADPAAPIDELYECVGSQDSWLGSATSGPYTHMTMGPRQDFQKGYIALLGDQFYAYHNPPDATTLDTFLAPQKPICVVEWAPRSAKRTIANTYNRIGGQLTNVSAQNNMDAEVVLGVWSVESSSLGGFGGSPDPSDPGQNPRPTIRVETHWLCWNIWGKTACDSNHESQSTFRKYFRYTTTSNAQRVCWSGNCPVNGPYGAANGWKVFHSSQTQEYNVRDFAVQKLTDGDATKKELVYRSMSVGGPQIMGFEYWRLGYSSAEEMFQKFSKAEFNQVKGFFDFMNSKCLLDSTTQKCVKYLIEYGREKNWAYVAWLYNGAKPGTQDNETWKNRFIAAYIAAREVLASN